MTQQLRQLRNEVTADTSQYVRALAEAERAAEALGQAATAVGNAVEQTDKKTTKSAAGFSALRRSLDPLVAAQDRLKKNLETLNTARALDKIDDVEHARLKGLLADRYIQAANAAQRAAKAQQDASRATQASAAAEQAGLQRLRGRYDEAYAAAERYNSALAEVNTLQRAGVLSGQSLANAYAQVERELNPVNLALAKQEAELKAAATAAKAHAATLDTLRGKYDADYAAAMKYNTALREVNELERAGALTGASLAAAKEKVERETNPLNVALEKERQAITALLGQLDPTRAASARLAEQEQLLARALAAGTISGTEHTAMLRRLRTQAGDTSGGVQLAAHQVTNLSYQLQDAAVQLQMGTNPFTILMQQAPQAVGAVGGVSNAASLMGSALRAVVSPAGLAVAGVVALGAAAAIVAARVASINAEMRRTAETLRALNPGGGLDAAGVRGQSFAIAQQRGVSRSDAAAGLNAAIRNRNIGGGLATQIAGVGQDLAAVLGIDPAQAAAKLAEAFAKGAAGVRELDKELGFLTAEQAKNIRLMEEQGNRAGALALAMQALEGRFGGAAKNMQSEWHKAFAEIGKTWDQFLERIAQSDISQKLAELAQSAARGWRSILGGDTDVSADIVSANKQLLAAVDALEKLERARASGSGMVNDRMIQEQAARVNQLREQVDALIERQRGIAQGMAPGGGPIVAPPRPGMTDDEIKRIGELREVLRRETEVMQENSAGRTIRLAGLQAELSALEAGATAQAAYEERLIAEERARLQLTTASNDQLRVMALETKQLMELADAYQISKAAVVSQLAVNEAEMAAATGQTQAQGALKQALLERAAAQAQVAGAQQIQALRDEVRETKALSAAALESAAAEEEVARANKVRLFSEQVLTAAVKSGRQDMIDAANEEIRVYDQLTKSAQEANRARQFNTAVRQQREALEIQQKEFELISAAPEVRAREMATIEATNRLKAMGKDITTAEGQEYIRNAGILAEQATRLGEVQRITAEATDNIVEAFTEMAEGGKDAFRQLRDFAIRMLKEIVAQSVIRPIIAPIVASAMGSIAGGMSGAAGAPGTGGGMSGAAGNLLTTAGGQALQYSGLMAPGGMVSSALGTTLIGGTTTGAITQSGSLAAAYSAPSTIAGSAGGLTAGGALGAAGVGFAAGGLVGGWLGNKTGSRVVGGAGGAVSGAAAGAALGSVVPGIGTLAGAIIGGISGLLGGVLGTASKPSNKEGNATVDLASGGMVIGGQTGDKFSQQNRDAAAGAAQTYGQIAKLLGNFAGRQVSGNLKVAMGDRDGMLASINGQSMSFKRDDAGIARMSKWITDTLAAQVGATLPADIRQALQKIDWKDLEKAIADINFAGNFQDSLKALRGDFGLMDSQAASAREEVRTLTAQINEFRGSALRLGLDTNAANDATRSYVEGLLGMRAVAAPMNEAEQAVALLRVRFEAMAPLLEAVGIHADEAGKGLQRAIAALRDDFISGLDREFHELSGREWINQIDATFAAMDDRLRSAAALGGGSDQVLRNNHQAIVNILEELENPALDEAAARYGGNIAIIAEAIKAARVVVEEAAPVIEQAMFDVAGWLRDLGREANELSGSGWINAINDQFGLMTERLGIATTHGVGYNEVLANNHLAMLRILRDLDDGQLFQAAERFGGGIREIAESLIAGRAAAAQAAAAQAAAEQAERARTQAAQEAERARVQAAEQAERARMQAAEERVQAARDAVQRAFQAEIDTQQELARTAGETRDKMRALADSLADFQRELATGDLSPGSPESRYNAARSQFEDIARRALAGDPDAMSQLQQASGTLLQSSREYNASGEGYSRDFQRVQQVLAQAQASASRQASAAEVAAAQAERQARLLERQLAAELGTEQAVKTIPQAIRELRDALLAQRAAAGAGAVLDSVTRANQNQVAGSGSSGMGAAGNAAGISTPSTPASSDMITNLYRQFLGREPDAAGYASWSNALKSGTPIPQIVNGIANSQEALARKAAGKVMGGMVEGGQWNVDSVMVPLAGGEYVTRAPAVTPGTLGTLEHINRTGRAPANDDTVAELRALRDQVGALVRISAAAGDDNSSGLASLDKRLSGLERKARLVASA